MRAARPRGRLGAVANAAVPEVAARGPRALDAARDCAAGSRLRWKQRHQGVVGVPRFPRLRRVHPSHPHMSGASTADPLSRSISTSARFLRRGMGRRGPGRCGWRRRAPPLRLHATPSATEARARELMATHGNTIVLSIHQLGLRMPVRCSGSRCVLRPRALLWPSEHAPTQGACSSRALLWPRPRRVGRALAIHTGGARGEASSRVDAMLHAARLEGANARLRSKAHRS